MGKVISKGKLLKGDIVEVEYRKLDGIENKPAECSEKHNAPPHKDLKTAFDALAVHAALIGEFVTTSNPDIEEIPIEKVKDFTVTGFSISGKLDDQVNLSAYKTLSSGKVLGLNIPMTKIDDDSENAYQFADELKEDVATCQKELVKYLEGKHAEDPQGDLFKDQAN